MTDKKARNIAAAALRFKALQEAQLADKAKKVRKTLAKGRAAALLARALNDNNKQDYVIWLNLTGRSASPGTAALFFALFPEVNVSLAA